MGFQLSTGKCNCWFCGRKDPAVTLAKLCNITTGQAIALLKSLPGAARFTVERPRGQLKLPKGIGPLQEPHRRYLKKRGFDPDAIARLWEVQAIGLAAKLQWRLFIPVFDSTGNVVSWTTRAIGNHRLRYISASPDEEAVPLKSLLYGAHLARHGIIVVEGPLDAWAIGPGAVATCGIGFSQAQLTAIASYPLRVVCLDSTLGAQKRADNLCVQLSAFPGITERVELESGEDAADADRSEIEEIRKAFLS